jgi:hypothetical protein
MEHFIEPKIKVSIHSILIFWIIYPPFDSFTHSQREISILVIPRTNDIISFPRVGIFFENSARPESGMFNTLKVILDNMILTSSLPIFLSK